VYALAFSSDGTKLVSGSEDHTIRIWNAVNLEDSLSFEDNSAHRIAPRDIAFLPTGTRIISRLGNEPVRVWDAETCSLLGELQHTPRDEDADVIVWSLDGSLMTTRFGQRQSLRIWNTVKFEMVAELERGFNGDTSFVCAAFSPDSRCIVSGMRNGAVMVWSTLSSEVLAEFSGLSSRIKCIAYSPAGTQFAAGGELTLRVWDAATYEEVYVYHSSNGAATRLEFSHDGARLMALFSSRKGSLCVVWSVDQFQVLAQFESDLNRPPAFTSDGRGVLFLEADDMLSAWMPSQAETSTCELPA
jgi:WD40 repeat protein